MANAAYDELRSRLPIGGVDWLTANIKATLVNAGYVYNAGHVGLADLGANVIAGITNQALTVTNVDATGFVSVDSATFSGATAAQTVKAIIVYVDVGGGITYLLWYFDTGTGFPLTTTGADVTVDWNGTAGNGTMWKCG